MQPGLKDDIRYPGVSYICSLQPNWWIFGLRGMLALIFGILALWMPAAAVLVMTIVFGAFAFANGLFCLISGIRQAQRGRRWGGLILAGVFGIATGLIVLVLPQIAAISLTFFLWAMIAFWSIATGIFELAAAVRLDREIKGEWLLGLSGILSVVFGIVVMGLFWFNPFVSVLTLGLLLGMYAMIYGILMLWLAFKLRNLGKIFAGGARHPYPAGA